MSENIESKTGVCRFNGQVDCRGGKCYACGWNPAVSERRIEVWMKKRLNGGN